MPTTQQPQQQPAQTKPPKKPKNKTITHTELGRIYLTRYSKNTFYSRGYWHRYLDGVWSPVPDFEIEAEVWKLMEMHEGPPWNLFPTDSMRRSIMSYVRSAISIPEEKLDAHPHLINLKNGIYNLDSDQFMPHDSALLLTSQLPFEYQPGATCPMWDLYTSTTFTDVTGAFTDVELTAFIQEAVGYSLTTDISHQVMFWCIGEGENGKGVLFHVLTALGGTSATYVDLNILRKEKYQLAGLLGKRIAMCSEANSHDNMVEDGIVKSLVAGDPTPVRQIRREPFILYPQVKLWWSMNRLPTITDTSHGFWRRMRPVPFNKIFEDGARIIDLKERLNLELPGIFNWCLVGLRRLRQNGKFSCCLQVNRMKDRLQTESNTIRLFLEDVCDIDTPTTQPPNKALSGTLYGIYKDWAKVNGYKSMSSRSFKVEMEALKFFHRRENTGRYFFGLKINSANAANFSSVYQPPFP